jgi:O-antigen biosynthesis protein
MRLFRKAKGVARPILQNPSALVSTPVEAETQLLQLFDSKWYLEVNRDVAAAGMDALTHFTAYGEAEERDPNPTFSTRIYREAFMRGESADASPLRHYLLHRRDLDPDELPELRRHIALMTAKPLFVIYLESDAPHSLARIRDMLQVQIYERWVLCIDLDAILRRVEQLPPEDWRLLWLDGSETLHSSALYSYASKINESPLADLIYADEDEIDDAGYRARRFFKPDWSPDYFESFNFVGTAACLSGRVCTPMLGKARGPYDLLLMATEAVRRVEHIRRVLIHRAAGLDSPKPREQIAQEMDALGRRLRRTGRTGIVTPLRPDRACYDIRLTLPANPLVSIVIPTLGEIVEIDGRQIDLLFNCLDTLAATSTYKNIEIVVIHNGDLGRARLEAVAKRGIKTLAYRGDPNVARKINIGAAASLGDYLLLMNDDIEPIAPDWVERLLEHFEKPHVGVVGAKLLFPSMKIQHAGLVLINAKPEPLRSEYPRGDEGYYFSTCAVRNFSALTGAVMMTRLPCSSSWAATPKPADQLQ